MDRIPLFFPCSCPQLGPMGSTLCYTREPSSNLCPEVSLLYLKYFLMPHVLWATTQESASVSALHGGASWTLQSELEPSTLEYHIIDVSSCGLCFLLVGMPSRLGTAFDQPATSDAGIMPNRDELDGHPAYLYGKKMTRQYGKWQDNMVKNLVCGRNSFTSSLLWPCH